MVDFDGFTDLELLMANSYGEARMVEGGWSDDVREYLAVGSVIMNRVANPSWGGSIKSVVLQYKQFSWTNEGDPSRQAVYNFLFNKNPSKIYRQMKVYAEAVLNGRCIDFSNGSDHYVALWLYEKEHKQSWIEDMEIRAIWGGHVFLKDTR
jgi:spore germination cell wall hydrolase CwlJ-like protein